MPRYKIVDRHNGRAYIDRYWPTCAAAESVRNDLLRHYPLDHEWRRRLYVAECWGDIGTVDAAAIGHVEEPHAASDTMAIDLNAPELE